MPGGGEAGGEVNEEGWRHILTIKNRCFLLNSKVSKSVSYLQIQKKLFLYN